MRLEPGRLTLILRLPAGTEAVHGTVLVAPRPMEMPVAQISPLIDTSKGSRRSQQQSLRLVTFTSETCTGRSVPISATHHGSVELAVCVQLPSVHLELSMPSRAR